MTTVYIALTGISEDEEDNSAWDILGIFSTEELANTFADEERQVRHDPESVQVIPYAVDEMVGAVAKLQYRTRIDVVTGVTETLEPVMRLTKYASDWLRFNGAQIIYQSPDVLIAARLRRLARLFVAHVKFSCCKT